MAELKPSKTSKPKPAVHSYMNVYEAAVTLLDGTKLQPGDEADMTAAQAKMFGEMLATIEADSE